MCDLNATKKPLPVCATVFYRKIKTFEPDRRHVLELAIPALDDDVPGLDLLLKRLRIRFGESFVGLHRDNTMGVIMRVLSEPLARRCGRKFVADIIAKITRAHYGDAVPVGIMVARRSLFLPHSLP